MRRRKQESGFALLLVFALAAAIAISLYTQLPRAAFESQRNKEEILIERGEQYKRGIQLFVSKNKRFPASLDELEKMGEIRYLRKRYVDPMTGKDDWRPIHVNAAGILTDSIIKKKEEKKENLNTFVSEGPSMAGNNPSETGGGVNLALRRRLSEQVPGANTDPNAPPPPPPAFQPDPNAQQLPGQQPGQQQPGQQQPGQQQPGQQTGQPSPVPFNPNQPNQPQQLPQQPGQQQPTYPNNPATPPNLGYGTIGSGYNANPNQPQQGQNQQQPGQMQNQNGQPGPAGPGNPALDLIGKILTSPRQQTIGNQGTPMGGQIGGGIAGFASKAEMPSIKIYNERQKYNEWEFVYDMKKDKRIMGNAAGMMGQAGQQQQNPNQTQNTAGFGSFGQGQNQSPVQNQNNSGFGQNQSQPGSGFGNAGSSFGQSQGQNTSQSGTGGSNSFITPAGTIGSTTTNNNTPNANQNPNQNQNPDQKQQPNQVPGLPGSQPQQPQPQPQPQPLPRSGPF